MTSPKCWETRSAFAPEVFLASLATGKYNWTDLARLVRRERLAGPDEIIRHVQRGYAFLSGLIAEEALLAADPYGRESSVYQQLVASLTPGSPGAGTG